MLNIPPPIDEPLKTYFAVELRPDEKPVQIVKLIMNIAKASGVLFKRLEMLDTITIGTFSYLRMRTEMLNPYSILDQLYVEGRAVVSPIEGGYSVRFIGGRTAKVSNLVMHTEPKLGQRKMFRGPKIKQWEKQFEAA